MLDIGWSELLLVAAVAVIVVGPKDLPRVLRTLGRWVGKIRAAASEFQSNVDDMIREAELDEITKQAKSITDFELDGPTGAKILPDYDTANSYQPPAEDDAEDDPSDGEAAADFSYEDYPAEGTVAPPHSLEVPEPAAESEGEAEDRPASRANG